MINTPTINLAIENLTHNQRQLDMDGCEVGVSRQALEEVLAYLSALGKTNMRPGTDQSDSLAEGEK